MKFEYRFENQFDRNLLLIKHRLWKPYHFHNQRMKHIQKCDLFLHKINSIIIIDYKLNEWIPGVAKTLSLTASPQLIISFSLTLMSAIAPLNSDIMLDTFVSAFVFNLVLISPEPVTWSAWQWVFTTYFNFYFIYLRLIYKYLKQNWFYVK